MRRPFVFPVFPDNNLRIILEFVVLVCSWDTQNSICRVNRHFYNLVDRERRRRLSHFVFVVEDKVLGAWNNCLFTDDLKQTREGQILDKFHAFGESVKQWCEEESDVPITPRVFKALDVETVKSLDELPLLTAEIPFGSYPPHFFPGEPELDEMRAIQHFGPLAYAVFYERNWAKDAPGLFSIAHEVGVRFSNNTHNMLLRKLPCDFLVDNAQRLFNVEYRDESENSLLTNIFHRRLTLSHISKLCQTTLTFKSHRDANNAMAPALLEIEKLGTRGRGKTRKYFDEFDVDHTKTFHELVKKFKQYLNDSLPTKLKQDAVYFASESGRISIYFMHETGITFKGWKCVEILNRSTGNPMMHLKALFEVGWQPGECCDKKIGMTSWSKQFFEKSLSQFENLCFYGDVVNCEEIKKTDWRLEYVIQNFLCDKHRKELAMKWIDGTFNLVAQLHISRILKFREPLLQTNDEDRMLVVALLTKIPKLIFNSPHLLRAEDWEGVPVLDTLQTQLKNTETDFKAWFEKGWKFAEREDVVPINEFRTHFNNARKCRKKIAALEKRIKDEEEFCNKIGNKVKDELLEHFVETRKRKRGKE